MKNRKILNITLIALMTAIICVSSIVTVQAGAVPFTLQTFGIFLALRALGGKKGTVSIIAYLALGIMGLPVFSGFGSGIGKLAGPTGGYLLGFVISGIVIIAFDKIGKKSIVLKILADALALLGCYTFGTAWFYYTMGLKNGMSLYAVLAACVIPFIIPDVIKIVSAEIVGSRAAKMIKKEM